MDLDFEKDGGLIPAIIQDATNGEVLVLGFMNREALARAERILSWGAAQIIVGSVVFSGGTIARRFLAELAARVGREKVIIALDTEGGKIAADGWKLRLVHSPEDVIPRLEPFCSGFLCTYVDHEGTMRGTDLPWFRTLRRMTRLPITAAGGIRSLPEVRALERIEI